MKRPVVIGTEVECGHCAGKGWINGAMQVDTYAYMRQTGGNCPPNPREAKFKPIVCPSCHGDGKVKVQA